MRLPVYSFDSIRMTFKTYLAKIMIDQETFDIECYYSTSFDGASSFQ